MISSLNFDSIKKKEKYLRYDGDFFHVFWEFY